MKVAREEQILLKISYKKKKLSVEKIQVMMDK